MMKVQEIFESLREKHGDKFKPEQLNAWANLIQMQKHASLDDPPTGRFFVTQKKSREVEGEAEVATLANSEINSPACRAMSSQACQLAVSVFGAAKRMA